MQFLLLFIVEAQCDENTLNNLVSSIDGSISTINSDIALVLAAKKNTRLGIDCYGNEGFSDTLFENYENLTKNYFIMKNVVTDLTIKKDVVNAELTRCQTRSK